MAPFDRSLRSSYSFSIVIMVMCRTVSEIKRYIDRKAQSFYNGQTVVNIFTLF